MKRHERINVRIDGARTTISIPGYLWSAFEVAMGDKREAIKRVQDWIDEGYASNSYDAARMIFHYTLEHAKHHARQEELRYEQERPA